MTRINLVPPEELCDQHLLAEHRELTRIPNAVAKGKYHLKGQPAEYKLGEGHVRFFFNKLAFLKKRYDALHAECKARGFNVQYIWNETLPDDPSLWLDYEATTYSGKNAIKGEIYTTSFKERSKIKEFSLMKGSENIKKVSIAHLMNCLIFQFNKKRTTRYDRQIVFMEIHKGFLWVYVFKKFWVKCFCHKLSGC